MVSCPWCGDRTDRLHPVPPEVVTRELVSLAGDPDRASGVEACADCISRFMEGELPA